MHAAWSCLLPVPTRGRAGLTCRQKRQASQLLGKASIHSASASWHSYPCHLLSSGVMQSRRCPNTASVATGLAACACYAGQSLAPALQAGSCCSCAAAPTSMSRVAHASAQAADAACCGQQLQIADVCAMQHV